ncbi:ADP-ribosylation factor-like protein [Elysia marginata]|uniref:ADP-ribosylation factor-like protein n=1 Tax=Elysia marginata TaxID=1093978 RepID=A0AAV4EIJ1_9GAST|nr:ADP-ribosylation factor-like protein [Elysia marginata]
MITTGVLNGFGVEVINARGGSVLCWDLDYRSSGRVIVREYLRGSHGVVYVIDSAAREKLDDALDELVKHILVDEQITGMVVMVLANKQDLPGAMTALEVEGALKQKYKFSSTSGSGHTVFVRPCSVKTMDGVEDAFSEFVEQLRLRGSGNALPGLIPLVNEDSKVEIKDASLRGSPTCESVDGNSKENSLVTRANIKTLCRDPLAFLRSIFH